jgi:hypothetical protein
METNHEDHSVRRIVLPSGRHIEVVRFYDTGISRPVQPGLHICRQCGSELVQPISWSEAGDDCWELTLECPNCWWSIDGLYDRQQVHELEERLDDGLADMLDDLKRLTHANMADQIDRFVAALESDLVLPEDF